MLRRWVEMVVARPLVTLGAVFVVTVLLSSQFRYLHLEIREANQLPQEHPYVQLYNQINARFGGGAVIVIGVVARQGDIFNPATLGKITRLTKAVQRLPEVAHGPGVLSLAAERVKGLAATADGIDVHTLMPEVPKSPEEIAALRAEVMTDDLYLGSLVSRDGTAAAIIAELPVDTSYAAIVEQIEGMGAAERDANTDIVLAGAPVLIAACDRYAASMAYLFPLAVLMMGLVHYEAFRTFQAMVLPLVTALVSVAWGLGVMGWLRLPLDTWSAMTPVAVLAVAAGHAVQILKRYYEEYARLGDNRAAVIESMLAVGPVMITAALIAAAGFASLAGFGVPTVRSFGMLMAAGIVSALAIELTLIPVWRLLLSNPPRTALVRERTAPWLTAALDAIANQVVRRPQAVLLAVAGFLAVCLVGAGRLHVDSSLRAYFAPDSPVRRDDAVINEKFAGASVLKILVEATEEGALHRPDVLQAIADLETYLRSFPEVRKTLGLPDYVRRMHRAMSPSTSTDFPDTAKLVAQYLLLYSFSKPDDLSGLLAVDHRATQVLAFGTTDHVAFVHQIVDGAHAFVADRFRGLPVRVDLPGGAIGAQAAMNDVIVREKLRNMVQVGAMIFILSALVLRSVTGALLVLSPLLAAVTVNFGIMGWLGVWLSISTAAVSAMGMSIGADFGIYLVFRLREELRRLPAEEAVRETLRTSGRAIFYVASAVALGYLVLLGAGFAAWTDLGLFTALIMSASALAVVTIVPSLVMVLRPKFLGFDAATAPVAARSTAMR